MYYKRIHMLIVSVVLTGKTRIGPFYLVAEVLCNNYLTVILIKTANMATAKLETVGGFAFRKNYRYLTLS